MKIHHIRNATMILTLGEHRLLVDPMLCEAGAFPGFKIVGGGRRRNPLVELPPGTDDALAQVTGVLLTHEHPDHFDVRALSWTKARGLPVWANRVDAGNLRRKGLDVREVHQGDFAMAVEVVRSRHGRGLLGWLMGPVAGYYLAHRDEPSLYITGDSVLTPTIIEAVRRLQPDVIVAPAGAANMGLGGDILFSIDELVELIALAPGDVVLNHLEALDHCPTTRRGLRMRMRDEGLTQRVHIPEDGDVLQFQRRSDHGRVPKLREPAGEVGPGFQKWVTARFAGT